MTLVEVVVALLIFTIFVINAIAVLLRAYEEVKITRHREQARAILNSFSDQFVCLGDADPIYLTTLGATGSNMTWKGVSGSGSGLPITLGGPGSTIQATLTRDVRELDETITSGQIITSPAVDAVGRMVQVTFSITFTVNTRTITETIFQARLIPNS